MKIEDDGQDFMGFPAGQNGTSSVTDCPDEEDNLYRAIPEITTEISSKNSTKKEIPFSEIISYVKNKTHSEKRGSGSAVFLKSPKQDNVPTPLSHSMKFDKR